MYPNIYCKRKYYGNNYNHYLMMMPPSSPQSNTAIPSVLGLHANLHPLAPPFEPKNSSQHVSPASQTQNEPQIRSNNKTEVEESTHTDATNPTLPMLPPPTIDTMSTVQDLQRTALLIGQTQTIPQTLPGASFSSESVPIIGFHPLQHIWTLWYLETDRSKTWEEMQNEISSIDNVEDFWRLYNHIKPASEIKAGCDYSLFKRGVRPMWEDEANREGGRWVITLPRSTNKFELDSLWLDVLLCLIGETFENSDQICGAVVNVRSKNNKISVWTANGQDAKAILEIGCKLRDILRLGPHQLQYQLHKDTMAKAGSGVKSVYII